MLLRLAERSYHLIMKRIIQVRVFRGEKYFVAECFDLPIVTQAPTLDELVVNIKEAIALQLEGEDPADFGLAPDASILASYELDLEPRAHAET
jgi:predicted RNase H-like HicB family nuclease